MENGADIFEKKPTILKNFMNIFAKLIWNNWNYKYEIIVKKYLNNEIKILKL